MSTYKVNKFLSFWQEVESLKYCVMGYVIRVRAGVYRRLTPGARFWYRL